MRGKIIKGIAGFYYVHIDGPAGEAGVYECRAKGALRRDNRRPLVGDDVEMDILDAEKRVGSIRELLPRSRELIRPAVANVSQALVIFAVVKPKPGFNLLDRFLIMMERQKVPCAICFNKRDLDEENVGETYLRTYRDCGYRVFLVSALKNQGMDELRTFLSGGITVIAGPSGVGKSSVVNRLQSQTVMETGQISRKIERGRHTTRHAELLAAGENTYIFDTPGFSSLDLSGVEREELSEYYPEFAIYEKKCRFAGCAHVGEPDCGVRAAVSEGGVSRLRYENYCLLYEELKNRKKY